MLALSVCSAQNFPLDSHVQVSGYFAVYCRFRNTHGRYPGVHDSNVEDDVPQLKLAAQQLLGEIGAASGQLQDDYVAEMCR